MANLIAMAAPVQAISITPFTYIFLVSLLLSTVMVLSNSTKQTGYDDNFRNVK